MFNINNILGYRKKEKSKFGKLSCDPINKILGTNFKRQGASIKKQNQWKGFNSNMKIAMRNIYFDKDGDKVPNKWDCQPYNPWKQDLPYVDDKNLYDKKSTKLSLNDTWPNNITILNFNKYCKYYKITDFNDKRNVLLDLIKREHNVSDALIEDHDIRPMDIRKLRFDK